VPERPSRTGRALGVDWQGAGRRLAGRWASTGRAPVADWQDAGRGLAGRRAWGSRYLQRGAVV